MKREKGYFNIHKLSHDLARDRFLHLPTLTDGLLGRIQREMMLNICHGSVHHLPGRLRSLFTAAVPSSKQTTIPVVWLCTPWEGARERGCSLLQHQLPASPMPGTWIPSRSQAPPGEIAFNDVPVVSSQCDLFILNSEL